MLIKVNDTEFDEAKQHVEIRHVLFKSLKVIMEVLTEAFEQHDWMMDDDTNEGKFLLETWKHIHEFMLADK